MPSVRVNRQGNVDPTASEQDARAGAALLEEKLHLFRNFEHLHWVITVPSVKDDATGAWKGGDLDGVGRRPRAGHRRQLHLRRSCQRRRRAARDQHLQDPAEPGERAAGAGRRDPGDVRRQSGLRRARAPLAGLQDVARRRPLHHDSQCRHEHDRPDGDLPHRPEHLPVDLEERDDRLPCAVARVLSLARSGESQSRAGLHGDLDRRAAGPGTSRV